jgi:heat shock protein HslJ
MDHDLMATTRTLRPTRRLGVLAVTVLAALLLAACSTDADTLSETEGLPSLQTSLEAHTWALQPARSTPPVTAGDVPTIAFDGDRVHGRGPCNTFRGDVEYGDDDGLTISMLATSLRACEPAVARAERSYLAALRRVDSADVPVDHEDTATLTGNAVRLVFHGFDGRGELTRTWHIVNVNTGDAIVGVASGTDPTVTFTTDGDLSLQTGCNPVAGSWELDGNRLDIGPLRQGLKACAGPEGEQEATLTRALESAHRVELAPDTLTILDDRGRIALIATAKEGS